MKVVGPDEALGLLIYGFCMGLLTTEVSPDAAGDFLITGEFLEGPTPEIEALLEAIMPGVDLDEAWQVVHRSPLADTDIWEVSGWPADKARPFARSLNERFRFYVEFLEGSKDAAREVLAFAEALTEKARAWVDEFPEIPVDIRRTFWAKASSAGEPCRRAGDHGWKVGPRGECRRCLSDMDDDFCGDREYGPRGETA